MSTLTSTITADALKHMNRKPDISHIPGERGWPIVGHTLKQLADPVAFTQQMYEKYGPVYRTHTFGHDQIALLGPEANELVLFDRDKIFSSDLGWTPLLERLFPHGLMLLDFEVHRKHRRIMQAAFKADAMKGYVASLNDGIRARLAIWDKAPSFKFYPAVKALTLDLAAAPFLGIPWGPGADKINRSFIDMVLASVAPIRTPLPGTAMRRGVKGRAYLCAYFGEEIPKRRGAEADDMLTILANAEDEDGNAFSDQEIIDHMNFLMMAAHDTLTSSLSSTVYELARSPEWQDKLRQEMFDLGLNEAYLPYERLGDLTLTEMAFKEVLRIHAPVPSVPRAVLRDFEFKGHHIPAGVGVGVNFLFTHHMADVWPEPERFDPMRFTPEAVAARHRFAWVPFGGGAHMCLGLHFAYMQAKVFLYHLLTTHRVRVEEGYQGDFMPWPIYKPKDGLPILMERL